MAESGRKAREIRSVLLTRGRELRARERALQNQRVAAWVNWEAVLVIEHRERAGSFLEFENELAALEDVAVVVPEDGYQHPPGKRRVDVLPIDVEEIRVERCLAILEHVHPPGIVGAHDADVIRHPVENVAHAVRAQRADERVE